MRAPSSTGTGHCHGAPLLVRQIAEAALPLYARASLARRTRISSAPEGSGAFAGPSRCEVPPAGSERMPCFSGFPETTRSCYPPQSAAQRGIKHRLDKTGAGSVICRSSAVEIPCRKERSFEQTPEARFPPLIVRTGRGCHREQPEETRKRGAASSACRPIPQASVHGRRNTELLSRNESRNRPPTKVAINPSLARDGDPVTRLTDWNHSCWQGCRYIIRLKTLLSKFVVLFYCFDQTF
jgi:hypothetical protein